MKYNELEPVEEGKLDFEHYHTYREVKNFLEKWASEYPDILDLYLGGKSFEGRDIYQVTLTNETTDRDPDKPGMMVDVNRYAGLLSPPSGSFITC